MFDPSVIKPFGYVLSGWGLAALGYVSWETVPDHMRPYLAAGVVLSLMGMVARWYSFVKENRDD